MSEFDRLFRQRIGFPQNVKLSFDTLDEVLEKTADALPFENLAIIHNTVRGITKDHLQHKILVSGEGGLCYELNPLLYLFLIENGMEAALIRASVYHHHIQDYSALGQTHAAILVYHMGQTYVVDTGFGGNLPLKPVPLNGEIVTSSNGQFRVDKMATKYGDYVLMCKLKHKDTEWKIGYAFDSNQTSELSEMNEVQSIVVHHKESKFNKAPLLTKLTPNGSITLTETSFTMWADGNETKEEIDAAKYQALMERYFGRSSAR